ncbi:MAG: diguanylate cyclase [Halopseudomonas sp.]
MLEQLEKTKLIEIASDQAFNAILITDANFADGGPFIEYCNPAFCRMTGYSHQELLGASLRILQGPKTDPEVIQSLRQALKQRTFWEGRTSNYRKNDEAYIVNWNISPVTNKQGELTHFVSVQQDVTLREQVTTERDVLIQALNQALDPVLVTDRDAAIIFVNQAFERLTGFAANEVLGKSPKLLSSGEQAATFYADMWRALGNNQPFQARFVNQRKDGSRYHAEQSIAPVLDSAGNCTHFISTSWKVDNLVEREKVLHAMANEDKLTGLLNRRAGDERLQHALQAFADGQQSLCVIFCDIDHFKLVNDRFGHLTGDRIIRQISQFISEQLRADDPAIRWGGEEFLLLVAAPLAAAEMLAERLRAGIEALADAEVGTVTLSFGVAEARPDEPVTQLLGRADAAMYRAKNSGRNRVCSA